MLYQYVYKVQQEIKAKKEKWQLITYKIKNLKFKCRKQTVEY